MLSGIDSDYEWRLNANIFFIIIILFECTCDVT
jgi:hypothetical protein